MLPTEEVMTKPTQNILRTYSIGGRVDARDYLLKKKVEIW